jgi:hypothetical protein
MRSFLWAICLLLTTALSAQLPTPSEFLPHDLGETFTPHHMLVDYFETVAGASPRVKLEEYGRTNEARPLMLAFVSTTENMNRLEAIRKNNLVKAGLLPPGEADASIGDIAIVWLSFSVHGNEAAGSEASMGVLYDLANTNDARISAWLENTVVVIDPSVNPDGYNRYTNWYRQTATKRLDPNPATREHNEPWPGGRVNHYLFDLNRDWAWQTQIESRQRMVKYKEWMPHVHADLHEQDYTSPYYFAPAAAPYHEYITDFQGDFQVEIGQNHARYFDREGWLYFTRERFDLLYPSYGDTWPTFNGSIGMTYEQGGHSRAGRSIDLPTGDELTLDDRVTHHRTTALSTVEIAHREAARLVGQFEDYFTKAVTDPQGEYLTYVVSGATPRGRMRELTTLLDRNGILYQQAEEGTSGRMYSYREGKEVAAEVKAGDLIISAFQPRSVLTQVLFDPQVYVEDSITYDITSWSLPMAYGLDAYASTQRLSLKTAPMDQGDYDNPLDGDLTGVYAYAIAWEDLSSARFLGDVLEAGVQVRTSATEFTFGEKTYPAGTLIINRGDNRKTENLTGIVREAARANEVSLDILKTGFSVNAGGDLGGSNYDLIDAPKVAVLSGEGVNPNQFGQVWYYFEQDLDYPVSLFWIDDLGDVAEGDYNVLVMPAGYYRLGERQTEVLTDWIRGGGKVIAIGSANRSMARNDAFGLDPKESETSEEEDAELLPYGGQERRFIESFNPGSILGVEFDDTHPLSFGIGSKYYSLKTGSTAYQYLEGGQNVGRLRTNPFVAGFIGNKAYNNIQETLVFGVENMGRGHVIYLVDNPLYRGFWQNGKLLFANALFQVN